MKLARALLLGIATLFLCAWRGGSTINTLSDWQFYVSGIWGGGMAPFNTPGLIHNANCGAGAAGCFSETFAYNTLTAPVQTEIIWSYPSTPSSGVYGFLQQSYGSSNGGPHSTPSVQIKNLNTLTSTHNISITGGVNNYDIIYDAFLTSTAYGTNIDEFSVQVHSDAASIAYINSITQIGTFTGSGVIWQVAQSAPGGQIIFVPSSYVDELSITIDMKAMFAYLVTQSVLTGNEYFNGIALGVEPYENGGTLTYNSWSMTQN